MKIVFAVTAFSASLLMFGCKANMPQETGFLSDYSKLQKRSSASMVYVNNQMLGKYSQFIIDPVQVHFYNEKDEKKVPQAKLQVLRNTMRQDLVSNLEKAGYQVVETPGPGVARMRIALTDIKQSTPVLNVIPQTAISGVGLGGASMEGELVDSQTNQQIAAMIESQLGQRFRLANVTTFGDAEAIINDWAQRIVQRINETHGR
jgi:hypothetical protein